MAKTDSFFIRASTSFNGTTYAQSSVDLGAYVDALGKSVLRIHGVHVQWGAPMNPATPSANSDNVMAFQLTTQSQAAMVSLTDKSVISSGKLALSGDAAAVCTVVTDSLDMAPQDFENGYLVGVEQIYLGVDASAASLGPDACNLILECTVETLNSSAAMAPALSQQ